MLGRGGFLCCVGARGWRKGPGGELISERGWAAGFDGCRLCGGCSVLCGVGWNDGMPLPRAGAGMCARRRSNLSLASPRTSHQREGDPAVRVPFAALRGNLRCAASGGVRANSLHCVSLKQRAALIRLKLCSSARTEGKGSRAAFRAIAALGPGVGMSVAQAVGQGSGKRSHWGRSEVAGS